MTKRTALLITLVFCLYQLVALGRARTDLLLSQNMAETAELSFTAACRPDLVRRCSDVRTPGGQMACLTEHRERLSSHCSSALARSWNSDVAFRTVAAQLP